MLRLRKYEKVWESMLKVDVEKDGDIFWESMLRLRKWEKVWRWDGYKKVLSTRKCEKVC